VRRVTRGSDIRSVGPTVNEKGATVVSKTTNARLNADTMSMEDCRHEYERRCGVSGTYIFFFT